MCPGSGIRLVTQESRDPESPEARPVRGPSGSVGYSEVVSRVPLWSHGPSFKGSAAEGTLGWQKLELGTQKGDGSLLPDSEKTII